MKHDKEDIANNGDPVYTLSWDSGAPGPGADVECIYKIGDAYYAILSYEGWPTGPYENLVEALRASELDLILSAVTEIECVELSDFELSEILRSTNDPGFYLTINGAKWQLDQKGQFVSPNGLG